MGDGVVKFGRFTFFLLLLIKCHHPAFAEQDVVINEILANEPGGATQLEWVELFNANLMVVDLTGWKFVSKSDTTSFEGVFIPAKGYLVLVRHLVCQPPDSNSFEAFWGDASAVWGDEECESFPAVQVNMSLTNRAGTVSLIDPSDFVSSFTWNKDWGDGISWEKIDPALGDSLENWVGCTYSEGSTPGLINSVTLAPNDLCIESAEMLAEPPNPREFEYFEIKARIQNLGWETSLPNLLTFFCDYDFDFRLETDESLGEPQPVGPIQVAGHLDFSIGLRLSQGLYRVYAKIGDDDKNYNNSAFIDVKVGTKLPDLIINEFMCSPDLSQPEWVELYNRSDYIVSLRNCSLGDSIQQNLITSGQIEVFPDEYVIVTENAAEFHTAYTDVSCQVIEPEKWAALNNTGDRIILQDSLDFIADQVSYAKDWGQGISWERVDSEKSSSDSDNWWRSVQSAGSTPCQQNSLRGGYSEGIELNILPNPFSPDGDGFEDEVRFKYRIPLKSELTLRIYDVKGRLVKTIFEQEPQVGGEITWDGKSDKYRTVRAGIYVVFLEAKLEHQKLQKKTTLVVAKK